MTRIILRIVVLISSLCFLAGIAFLIAIRPEIDAYEDKLTHLDGAPEQIASSLVPAGTTIYDRHDVIIGNIGVQHRHWVPLSRVPKHVSQAFLAAEDGDFYFHFGVSPKSIIRAAWTNLAEQRVAQGGSTLTQQVARMLFLSREQTFLRKTAEAYLALVLESKLTKDQILELYLNLVFLGNHSQGVSAAATNYFGKAVSELTVGEAAMLAGLPKAPSQLAPHKHYAKAKARQIAVLKRMREEGYLSEDKYLIIRGRKVVITDGGSSLLATARRFVIDEVQKQLSNLLARNDFDSLPLDVQTTLDWELVVAAHTGMQKLLKLQSSASPAGRANILQGAMYLQDQSDGAILAMVGGRDYRTSQFNLSFYGRRPLGSAFLPVYYGLALERGATLNHPLYADYLNRSFIHRSYRNDAPRNSKALETDPTLLGGLLQGRLFESARLFSGLGVGTVLQYAKKIGLTFRRNDLSLALGHGRTSLLNWSAAMSVYGNQGVYYKPYMIKSIRYAGGKELYRHKIRSRRVLRNEAAFVMDYVLRSNDPKSFLGKYVGQNRALHDGWAVGYSKNHLLSVWLGSEQGRARIADSSKQLTKNLAIGWNVMNKQLAKQGLVYSSVSNLKQLARPDKIVFRKHPIYQERDWPSISWALPKFQQSQKEK